MNSLFLRLIISVPVIVAATLLAPVLGVLLMILRYIVSDSRKDRRGSIAIIIIGILLLIPRWIFLLSEGLNFNLVISTFFRNIVNNRIHHIFYHHTIIIKIWTKKRSKIHNKIIYNNPLKI